jgi:hypothetical protein
MKNRNEPLIPRARTLGKSDVMAETTSFKSRIGGVQNEVGSQIEAHQLNLKPESFGVFVFIDSNFEHER